MQKLVTTFDISSAVQWYIAVPFNWTFNNVL